MKEFIKKNKYLLLGCVIVFGTVFIKDLSGNEEKADLHCEGNEC